MRWIFKSIVVFLIGRLHAPPYWHSLHVFNRVLTSQRYWWLVKYTSLMYATRNDQFTRERPTKSCTSSPRIEPFKTNAAIQSLAERSTTHHDPRLQFEYIGSISILPMFTITLVDNEDGWFVSDYNGRLKTLSGSFSVLYRSLNELNPYLLEVIEMTATYFPIEWSFRPPFLFEFLLLFVSDWRAILKPQLKASQSPLPWSRIRSNHRLGVELNSFSTSIGISCRPGANPAPTTSSQRDKTKEQSSINNNSH